MNDATRTCLKCGCPVRFLLCDPCYAATPHCDEPIETNGNAFERAANEVAREVRL